MHIYKDGHNVATLDLQVAETTKVTRKNCKPPPEALVRQLKPEAWVSW